jgi:acetylornithine deacetylase/succinyl-diaminopimelate desuccinylase-like protein
MMTVDELRSTIHALMPPARRDLEALVSLESVADPSKFPAENCARAAHLVADLFRAEGLADTDLYATPDGSNVVIGHAEAPHDAPTVLLYCHYDVQPPLSTDSWRTPPFELTESGGRWYGRGAADCKGNIVTHLTALRALGSGNYPVGVILVAEGSEEQGTGGLEAFVAANPGPLRSDAILVCDAGNIAVGVPTVTTTLRGVTDVRVNVESLADPVHSGVFGGPAPDALVALIHILSTLHDERGNTTVRGLESSQRWSGAAYPASQFRVDAKVLEGVELLGDGNVADMLWARPAVTVLGIDCPSIAGASATVPAKASALVSLRIPTGTDATQAQNSLVTHLSRVAPWGVHVSTERDVPGASFSASVDGPAYEVLAEAMRDAYGRDMVTTGDGGSIPLCDVLQRAFPEAEIAIIGVEEPLAMIHGPNESVDPTEIANMALVEALFIQRYSFNRPPFSGAGKSGSTRRSPD